MTQQKKQDTAHMTVVEIWKLYEICMWHSDQPAHSYWNRDKWRQLALDYRFDLVARFLSEMDELSLSRLIPIAENRHDEVSR